MESTAEDLEEMAGIQTILERLLVPDNAVIQQVRDRTVQWLMTQL